MYVLLRRGRPDPCILKWIREAGRLAKAALFHTSEIVPTPQVVAQNHDRRVTFTERPGIA